MNKINQNKRGFLLAEETLKIIIAVICIIFLAYLLFSLYNSNSKDNKINQAKENLLGMEGDSKSIEKIVRSLQEGEDDIKDISNPSGWHVYSFTDITKPNSCLSQRCLCICEKALVKQINSQEEKCDKSGVCLIIPGLVADLDLKIGSGAKTLFLDIKKYNGKIFIEEGA